MAGKLGHSFDNLWLLEESTHSEEDNNPRFFCLFFLQNKSSFDAQLAFYLRWTLALASSNSRSSFKWKCVAESPKHDTTTSTFSSCTLSNGSKHAQRPRHLKSHTRGKMRGSSSEHCTNLLFVVLGALVNYLACETLFFRFGGVSNGPNRRYVFYFFSSPLATREKCCNRLVRLELSN